MHTVYCIVEGIMKESKSVPFSTNADTFLCIISLWLPRSLLWNNPFLHYDYVLFSLVNKKLTGL